MPPTYSLLGDYFPAPTERAQAMSIYWLANPMAGLIGFIAGGWLNALYGWRITFFVMGLPALLIAVLVRISVVEPRTRQARQSQTQELCADGLLEITRLLWQQTSTRHLIIAIVLFFTMALGMAPWYATFMMRAHGMGTAILGTWLGLIFTCGGIVGVISGGQVASRWLRNNERGQMRLTALMIALLVPCYVVFLLVPDKHEALFALFPLVVVLNFAFGPTFALLQRLVSDDRRATALAVTMLLANLIGIGIGPQVVGILSDSLAHTLGHDSLRYAMLAMSFVSFWAAFHFWWVGKSVAADLLRCASADAPSYVLPVV